MAKSIKGIEDLQPDPKNANQGTERGLGMVEDSLRNYGAGRSILVDKDGVVIAGNKCLEVAADLGLPVRVVKTDGHELVVVQREDLDLDDGDGKARGLAYADNRSSEVGLDWDLERILADVEAGVDFAGLWGEQELGELLKGIIQEPQEDPGPQIDRAEELREKWQTERGQIWGIGKHRLMCGDSTSEENVGGLMGGQNIRSVVTDPPYGVSHDLDYSRFVGGVYGTRHNTKGTLEGDDRVFDPRPLLGYESVVLWGANFYGHHLPIGSWLVWDKRFKDGGAFLSDAELAWMKGGYGVYIHSETSQGFVRPERVQHPTQKPVGLIEWCIEKSNASESVYDPFLGSGTTMVAAEQTGRICYGMEISPAYCAVTLERMAGMGLKPNLIES